MMTTSKNQETAHMAGQRVGSGSETLRNRAGILAVGSLMLLIFSLLLVRTPTNLNQDRCGVAHTFGLSNNIGTPALTSLSPAGDGSLLGTTLDESAIYRLHPESANIELLHVFPRDGREGYDPAGGLTPTRDGMFFGTGSTGGTAGGGTIFRANRSDGEVLVLHNFGILPSDGWKPIGKLVEGPDDGLYGTTTMSGKFGGGTAFRIMPDGSGYKTIHHFGKERSDGIRPNTGLTVGGDGKLYGVTVQGGDQGLGCVFRLSTEGEEFEVLHSFGDVEIDGAGPHGSLLFVRDTLVFGTTSGGGRHNVGAIYCLDTRNLGYKVVHHFNGNDGAFPQSDLIQGPDGSLYGTAAHGGDFGGTLYKLEPGGDLQVLHKFGGWYSPSEGASPYAGVVLHEGVLYGTTKEGGENGLGTIFRYPL